MTLITNTGTVIEFVIGSLGWFIPSVARMLNCRTVLFELDCEGVGVWRLSEYNRLFSLKRSFIRKS